MQPIVKAPPATLMFVHVEYIDDVRVLQFRQREDLTAITACPVTHALAKLQMVAMLVVADDIVVSKFYQERRSTAARWGWMIPGGTPRRRTPAGKERVEPIDGRAHPAKRRAGANRIGRESRLRRGASSFPSPLPKPQVSSSSRRVTRIAPINRASYVTLQGSEIVVPPTPAF